MSIAAAKPVATSYVKMKPVAFSSVTSRITLVTKVAKITSSVALASVIHNGRILYTTNRYSTLTNAKLVALTLDGKQELLPLWQACEGSIYTRGEAFFFTRFSFQGSFT